MAAGDQSVDDLKCLAGRVLDGRYELETFVDRGAFGVVYRATDRKLNSLVAVKIGRSYREFMKEAKLAAGVRHPNIVHVTDYGLDGDLAYLVMEFLEGDDLDKLLHRSDNPVNAAMIEQLVCEVGDALVHAHSMNLIHRDLKPPNIIFRQSGNHADVGNASGRFVLLDFGIAAQLDAEGTQRNVTWDGAGTAEYIAPEMLQRNPVATPQCDIYGFGTILYLMLTGRVPFPQLENSRLGLANCLKAVAHDPPPPFASVAAERCYPPALEELVLQCLEKDPARRPPTISEVCERFLADYSPESDSGDFSHTLRPGGLMDTSRRRLRKSWQRTSPTPHARRRNAVPIIAIVMCVAAIVVALWVRSTGGHRDDDTLEPFAKTITTAPVRPRPILTAISGASEQAFDAQSPLRITAGEAVELKFRIEDVPPDRVLDFSSPLGTSPLQIEMRAGEDEVSRNYSVVVPDRNAQAGLLPPIKFVARVAGVETPVEAMLYAEIVRPEPRLVLEGTLEPADALLTADGETVDLHDGRWTWSDLDKEQVTLKATRDGFEGWEQTLSGTNASPISIVLLKPPPTMRLEGTLEPADAKLTANGAAIDVRDGVWTWSSQEQSPVTLKAVREGFEDWELTVEAADASTVPITLEQIPAIRLGGTLEPADAELAINGTPIEALEGRWNWSSKQPVEVTLKAHRDGFQPWEQTLSDGQPSDIDIVLDRLPAMQLAGTVDPDDAVLTVNGNVIETQAGRWTWSSEEPVQAVLKATREGFADWEQTLTDVGQIAVPVQMESSIAVFPADALVQLDGQPIATEEGKFSLHLPAGSEVVVTLTREQQSQEFRLTRQALADLGYSLRLPEVPVPIPPDDPKTPAELSPESVATLISQMNDFCVVMYKTYIGMDEFGEAYREAYEILQLSRKIEKFTSAGISGEPVNQLLSEMAGEMRHVEHHIAEFAQEQRPANKKGQQLVFNQLAQVERTLDTMLEQAGLPTRSLSSDELAPSPDDGDSSHGSPAADPAQLSAALVTLREQMNVFCAAMYKSYRGMDDFDEAYQEAYELLELSKQLKVTDQFRLSNRDGDAIRDSLRNFDGELQHVETHITEFARAQRPPDKAAQEAVFARLDDVESTLHSVMRQLGIEGEHADAEKSTTDQPQEKRVSTAQLARNLVVKANSFRRALQHNFKKNADFPEAYEEAQEFYNASVKVADLLEWGLITKECHELITRLDGEVHHLEIHVSGFVADDSGTKEGASRVVRKLLEVEEALHALGKRIGVKIQHPE